MTAVVAYSARLFGPGFRGNLHRARFKFLGQCLHDADCSSIFELGCFDAKSIYHLPSRPKKYLGCDAGWEGGIDIARATWPQYQFRRVTSAAQLEEIPSKSFNNSICMETLEHVPPDEMEPFIRQMARITTGFLVVTVPVEIGPMFLAKNLAKRSLSYLRDGDKEALSYTLKETVCSTLGLTQHVERGDHKGFNYADVHAAVVKHFDVIKYEGHPFHFAPRWLNFGVGILAKAR